MTSYSIQVLRGSDDITTYVYDLKWVQSREKEFDSLVFKVSRTALSSLSFSVGNEIKYYRDGVLKFGGFVEKINEDLEVKVECLDYGYELMKRIVTESYSSTTTGAIIKDIIDNYTSLDSTNVTGNTAINRMVINKERAYDVIKRFAKLEGKQFYTKPNKDFYYEDEGNTDSGITLEVGVNCYKVGRWKKDKTRLANSIIAYGKRLILQKYETFSGDGTTTEFVLTYKPEDYVRVLVGSVELKGGIENATTNAEYYVDKQNKKITFVTAPASGTDNIEVYYGYSVPLAIEAQDPNSIIDYGQHDAIKEDNTFENRDDLLAYVQKRLDKYASPFVSCDLETSELSLNAGDLVTVIDSVNNINDTYVIYKVEEKYPMMTARVSVGPVLNDWVDKVKSLDERVENLEKQARGESELLTKVRSFYESFGESLLEGQFKGEHRTIGTAFILGHSTNGVLGTSTLGAGTMSAYSTDFDE